MTEYQPGTIAIATVRGVEGVRIVRTEYDSVGMACQWMSIDGMVGNSWHHANRHVTDIRPLVVLDLGDHEEVLNALRAGASAAAWVAGANVILPEIADQIEAQTKPARIPEPGPWGVVEASLTGGTSERFTFVRTAAQGNADWIITDDGSLAHWKELVDPVLIREGLS